MSIISNQDRENLLPSLASLAEFAQSSAVGFNDHATQILGMANEKVLMGIPIQSVSRIHRQRGSLPG